jgi:hypothetical protein
MQLWTSDEFLTEASESGFNPKDSGQKIPSVI